MATTAPNDKPNEPFVLTLFADQRAYHQIRWTGTMGELAHDISVTTAAAKDVMPWLKFALFGNVASDKGCLRHDDNVTALTGFEADIDGGRVNQNDAARRLQRASVSCLLYATPSSTAAEPHYRVVGPASHIIEGTPDELRQIRAGWVARINGILGGVVASESFALSQSYYFGTVRDGVIPINIVEGDCIDLCGRLDAQAIGKPHRQRTPRKAPEGLKEVGLSDARRSCSTRPGAL
jgi:hypothetical protein